MRVEESATRRTLGTGQGVAALFNGRAKQVTPSVVRALRKALPDAQVFVSDDLEQAQRHAELIAQSGAEIVLSGGGDGAAMRLLNMLRQTLPKERRYPTLGVLMLGTGNAWAHTVGAPKYSRLVERLRDLTWPLPTRRFELVEIEGLVCPFAGVGWDARILNDYQRNLDRRSSQVFGSRLSTRLHKGLGGYLYSVARYTVPEEWGDLKRQGPARVTLERVDGPAFTLDEHGSTVPTDALTLFEGPVSVGAAASIPEWGYGFRAFPFATRMGGFINVRVYDRPVTEAVRNMRRLWSGVFPQPGMHDFFVKRARMRFSRPMPFQIGGDAHGARSEIEFTCAGEAVRVVDWGTALTLHDAGH